MNLQNQMMLLYMVIYLQKEINFSFFKKYKNSIPLLNPAYYVISYLQITFVLRNKLIMLCRCVDDNTYPTHNTLNLYPLKLWLYNMYS
jgi:hypothetical protein